MTEPTPYIDYANLPNPAEGFLVTLFGQSTGLLHGQLAAKRPEDLPG